MMMIVDALRTLVMCGDLFDDDMINMRDVLVHGGYPNMLSDRANL